MSDSVISSSAAALVPWDRDFSIRTYRLDILRRVLDGSLYSSLQYRFDQERSDSGNYIPLRERQPSVRYPLARIVVEDSVALLFSESHIPAVFFKDEVINEALAIILKDVNANAIMIEAAWRGSVGSVAILLRVLGGRLFLDVLDSLYLTPEWDISSPDRLVEVTELYKVAGAELVGRGYTVDDPNVTYWFRRVWSQEEEIWYLPCKIGGNVPHLIDYQRTVAHGFGFVPIIWIKNLPGGDRVDGGCTFSAAIDTSMEIDYQLSQAGRGLKYSSDPTLLIKEPAGFDGTVIKGAANALVVSEKGDAKLLEIGGSASEAVINYVRTLREFALESMHGNRVDSSRLATPASGRSLELMNQGLLWLADNLRISYGEGALIALSRMILRATKKYSISINQRNFSNLDSTVSLGLLWPPWYPSDSLDRQRDATTLIQLVSAGQLSRETALRILAPEYDIEDLISERRHLAKEAN